MDISISEGYSLLVKKLQGWLNAAIEMLPNFLLALIILIAFFVIGKLVRKAVSQLLHKVTDNDTIIDLLETIVGVVVISIGVFIALGVLQLQGAVTSLLAGAGIIGLALGFAFQDIAANFMSGIILSIRHPFGIGDMIEFQDYYGYVHKINLRCTIVRTTQGQLVYIPNKEVFNNAFTNYTWNKERRIDLECGVSYGDDLVKVKKIAVEAIKALEEVKDDRPVQLVYKEFGDSSINFDLRFWVPFTKNFDYKGPKSKAIIALKKTFDENDIDIPWPIRSVEFGVKDGKNLGHIFSEQIADYKENGENE